MNPFNWPGPEFLVFYVAVAAAILVAQWWRQRLRESEPSEPVALGDAYLMAYLQGGKLALARAAIASLLSREKLEADDQGNLVAAMLPEGVESPVEQAALDSFRSPQKPSTAVSELCSNARFRSAVADLGRLAQRAGLLPGVQVLEARRSEVMLSVALLVGVAAVKILLAISRGRGNFWLLALLSAAGCLIAFLISRGRLTYLGKKTLADTTHLYSGMPGRVSAAQGAGNLSSQEVAITAGLFGLGVLGASSMQGASLLRGMEEDPMIRRARVAGDSACGSSDSSSDGSSSSSCSSSGSSCSSCGGGSSCGGCSSS